MSMRLQKAQIAPLVNTIINTLTLQNEFVKIAPYEPREDEPRRAGPVPTSMVEELRRDISGVLQNYLNTDQRLHNQAREQVERAGEDHSEIYNRKRALAKREDFGLGDDAPTFIITQLIEALLHSSNVEEIYASDAELRAVLLPELREAMSNQRNVSHEMAQRVRVINQIGNQWEDLYTLVKGRLSEKYQLD
jgi:hypothetical protein